MPQWQMNEINGRSRFTKCFKIPIWPVVEKLALLNVFNFLPIFLLFFLVFFFVLFGFVFVFAFFLFCFVLSFIISWYREFKQLIVC